MNKIFNWVILCVIFLMQACSHAVTGEKEMVKTVRLDTVRLAEKGNKLLYPGKVKASQDVNLSFKVSGTIGKIAVKEGQLVHAGDLLAYLDPVDYQIQLDATEAEYRQVKAEAERVIALYEDNATTANLYDKAVYGLKQITAKYNHHKDQLAYTRLYAPFTGYVQKRLFNEYETVGSGMPILSMIGNSSLEVEINLPAIEYVRIDKFRCYSCTFDVFPGKTYLLKPISVSPKANANQLYTMRLQLDVEGQALPSPGMNTMVSIECDNDYESLLQVSGEAVVQSEGKSFVFVYRPEDSRVSAREVKVAKLLSDGGMLISSTQLKEGELIVSSGTHSISEGEEVDPLPGNSVTNVGGLL